jgi:hypothetical protein
MVFGLMIGFIGLFDTARDYILRTLLHEHTRTIVHSQVLIAVAW